LLGLLISCPVEKVFDTLYGVDLSGDKQVVEVGKPFKPLRVKTLPGCEVEFIYLGDTIFSKKILSSGTYAIFYPPVPKKEGDITVLIRSGENSSVFRLKVLRKNFGAFLLLEFFLGFVLFIFGLDRGSTGIMRAVGGWTRKAINRLSSNRFLALLGGIMGAMGFQSSTAVTVMVVSLTDLGMISPNAAVVMNAGAGIGTTITVGILSLGISQVSIILITLGFLLERLLSSYRHYGRAIFGFGLAFFGIWYMGEVFYRISEIPSIFNLLSFIFGSPNMTLILSIVFSALVHSSALTLGTGISLAYAGILNFESALALVLGANVGTAFTAVLASSNLSGVARKVALVNLLGRFIFSLLLLFIIPFSKNFPVWTQNLTSDIALAHIYYNLLFAITVIPISYIKPLWEVREREKFKGFYDMLVTDPEIATVYMEKLVSDALNKVILMFQEVPDVIRLKSPSRIYSFQKMDDEIDEIETKVNALLGKLSESFVQQNTANKLIALAYIMEEIENAGDIMSKSIGRLAEKMYKEGINLSEEEINWILIFHREVLKTFADAMVVLSNWDKNGAKNLYNRKDEVKTLLEGLKREFYSRGFDAEKLVSGEVYLDILSDLERINFHMASIGGIIYENT
jgi:Na+/phosphate symporter